MKRRKKPDPLHIAQKAINDAFNILLNHDMTYEAEDSEGYSSTFQDPILIQCFEVLSETRIRLDQINSRKQAAMKDKDDSITHKLKRELESCERSYVSLARMNPRSVNETQNHLAVIDKLVRDMKRIRKRLCRTTDDRFLTELLYPPEEAQHEQP